MRRHKKVQSGMTLVELVTILLILAILSASAVSKFFDTNVFQDRVNFDDLLHAIRYARIQAVATGCNVSVQISSNQLVLKRPSSRNLCKSLTSSDFTLDIARPGTNETNYIVNFSNLTASTATFYFNALGEASAGQNIVLSNGKKITVVQSTGFSYDSTI